MIKDNQQLFNRMQVLVDAVVIVFSYLLSWGIYFGIFVGDDIGKLPVQIYMFALIFLVPGLLILYYAFSLYTPKRVQGRRLEASNIVKANVFALLVFMFVLYNLKQIDFSRGVIYTFTIVNVIVETIVRNAIRGVLMNIRRNGMNLKHVLLVGYSRAAEEYIDRVKQNPQWGYLIRGVLDDNVARGTRYKDVKVIGQIDNLNVILPQNRLDEIVITLGLNEYFKLEHIVSQCEKSGVHTKFVPDYNKIIPTKPYTEDLIGLPVINIRHVPLSNTFNQVLKRIIDFFGSLAAIVIFSPVMLLAVIMIKLTSPGPLIFKQERVGLHNKPFYMYKFRSMEVQKEEDEKVGWTKKNDPRVTGFGKFMRKTSVDELPQLFNVLKGDMSMVGPRPERPQFVEKFREEIPRYMIKHQVRPGITGWAQVSGYRGDTSIKKRIEYDLYYIENWTVGFDFKILFLTIFKGFINKNAY